MRRPLNGEIVGTLVRFGGAVAAVLIGAWLDIPIMLQLLIVLMVIDIVTGVLVAINDLKLSSRAMRKGLVKKALILCLVGTAAMLENCLEHRFGLPDLVLTEAVCGFFAASEGLSIIENAGNLGVPIPKVLKMALVQLQKGSSEDATTPDEGAEK